MTTTDGRTAASVLLRLYTAGDDETARLRQQLALCLATGIDQIRVDVRRLDHLTLPALQALQGVSDYLRRKGGALTLVGAGPRVLATVTHLSLTQLLPSTAPTPVPAVPERRTAPSPTSRVAARVPTPLPQEHVR